MLKFSVVEKVHNLGSRRESLIGTLVLLALAANCAAAPGTSVISGITSTAPGGFVSTGTSLWVTDAVAGFCQITAGAGGASQLQNCIKPPTGSANAPALLGQPAYDPTGYVYLPDYSASSKGIWRYNFDGLVFDPNTGFN